MKNKLLSAFLALFALMLGLFLPFLNLPFRGFPFTPQRGNKDLEYDSPGKGADQMELQRQVPAVGIALQKSHEKDHQHTCESS